MGELEPGKVYENEVVRNMSKTKVAAYILCILLTLQFHSEYDWSLARDRHRKKKAHSDFSVAHYFTLVLFLCLLMEDRRRGDP